LKSQPEFAEELLAALKDDSDAYVRVSVGNWLNDASKSRPDWVEGICAEWLRESGSRATRHICRRGIRTLGSHRLFE
jgi:3-methyladenine DNA glycosylase AlkC